ncbi:MAG: hypothetical protein AUG44_07470 [Actinobacteria bacterium 13_1_20CM_3_71_11]|nr:MAG: hypothetical protein AUG44_07470 [Actinobacteria bacterium 13_1_20CM_3_71_11]
MRSSTTELSIAVVGAGIAGLSVAAFLARAGYPCTVYEQAVELTEVGAGIQVSPNGSVLLHRIGLAGHLADAALRPEAIEQRSWHGGLVARTAPGTTYGAPYYTLHRARLHAGLLGAAGPVLMRKRCTGIREHRDRVELRFADSSTADADLVVGADGLHSSVRRALVADEPRDSGLTVHRGLIAVPAEPTVTVWYGPGAHVVRYPIPGGLVNVVAVLGADADPTFAAWPAPVRALVARLDPTTRAPLYDRPPLARWHTDRIVLVGDAAHPLLPLGAQGASQAIEDAAALAACLRRWGAGEVPRALRRYERVRMPRLAQLATMVRDNTANHHLPDGTAQRMRDAAWRRAAASPTRSWLHGYDAERVVLGPATATTTTSPIPGRRQESQHRDGRRG